MKCKNCGAPLDEGALFCRRCGTAAPKTPEPAGKRTVKMNASSGASDRIRDLAARTGAWFSGTFETIRGRFGGLRDSKLFRNRRLLMLAGAGAALLEFAAARFTGMRVVTLCGTARQAAYFRRRGFCETARTGFGTVLERSVDAKG